MRPAEIKREIERLTVDASSARSQIAGLKQRLTEVRSMVTELRETLSGAPAAPRQASSEPESTPGPRSAQEGFPGT